MEEKEAKKGKKKVLGFTIVVVMIAIIVAFGVMVYFRYKAIEEEKHRIAVETVDEITNDNLSIDYNKNYTNQDILLTLASTSQYELSYRIEKEEENTDYIKYETPITITENTTIFLKYKNSYGTYSKNEYKIEINNIDKEKPNITKKEASATTSTVKLNIEATDNIAISKIEVSIDGKKYKEVTKNTYTFDKLKEGTAYTVKIRVQDTAGNTTEDEMKSTTKTTPKPEPEKTQTNQTTNTSNNTTANKNTNTNSNKNTNTSTNNNSNKNTNTSTKPSSSSSSNSNSSSSSGKLTKAQKEAQARVIAKQIAKECTGSTQLERVEKASRAVYGYYRKGVHKETGDDYYTAYGVFILGESSCAGCCRALGMVLDEMGIKWKHINENLWTHQWLEVTMDGQKGWADANVGYAGYGEWGYWL